MHCGSHRRSVRGKGRELSNLKKELDIQIQEAQRTLKKINPKRPTASYVVIKLLRERMLTVARKSKIDQECNTHKEAQHCQWIT